MSKITTKINAFLVITLLCIMLIGALVPISQATDGDHIKGFEKGIPWQPFETLKKVTFVNFDKDTLIDDYAYLASIPASVFSDGETIYSSPLILFQPRNAYPDEEKYQFLNDYQSIEYLMEDWMSYCNGRLDQLITINVDENDLEDEWKTKEYKAITGEDPFEIASEIALQDWSYSDSAVIAVIEKGYETPKDTEVTGKILGKISGEIGKDTLTVKRPYGPAPEYEYFEVGDEYIYVRVDLYYPAVVIDLKLLSKVPIIGGGITLPSVDPDLQLFCKYEGDWLQTNAAAGMTITNGPHEKCFSYVYNPGDWRIGVTNMPTEGLAGEEDFKQDGLFGKITYYGNKLEAISKAFLGRPVTQYYCDVTMYPGVEEIVPDLPPFGCRDATFKLTWGDNNIQLGLTVLGPSGEELESVMKEDTDSQEIHFDMLGECLEGENYKIVVYALTDVSNPVDFKVEYSWQQNITRKEADLLASACQGAILGSIKNKPLLYTKPDELPDCTSDTLYKLGVEDICVVDLGGYLTEETKNELSNIAEINEHYIEYKNVYDAIMEHTGSNDVIFSTIDPWSYWYGTSKAGQLKPDGEFENAFHFGPAAYAAAHHGSPLLLVDNHPELSGAVTWHGEFWRKNAHGFNIPPIAPMFLTGSRVYDFLREYGFDKEGVESILTVAGQYEIGPTWSRVFAGVGNPGNIIGTPVDASCWIARSIFYPGLIFQNPALKGEVELVNGSISTRLQRSFTLQDFAPLRGGILSRLFPGNTEGLSNLKITRESGPEKYQYPVLHTYGCYGYRFNERGADYWGTPYQTRTGIIPGQSLSGEEIDEGTRVKYEGLYGAFLPDISESEITPFYAAKAGYSNCFSTNFDITMENLNKGVISWYMILHGFSGGGGCLAWFSPPAFAYNLENMGLPSGIGKLLGVPFGLNPTTDVNPWRGYEILWGSTEEPDSACLNAEIGLFRGILGLGLRDNPGIFKIGLDLVPSSLAFPGNIPILRWFNIRDNLYDGLVGPMGLTALLFKFGGSYSGADIDDKLENLHSMSFHANSCLIACNYLHITMMRHGAVAQELDPWATSYWGGYVFQQTPKDFALGETIGESFAKGRCEIGIKYLFEEDEKRDWWWDSYENVVLFADPDLRIWVPSTEWDPEAKNHWEREDVEPMRYQEDFNIAGHTPFGATSYPHAKEPLTFWQQYLLIIIVIVIVIATLVIAAAYSSRRKRKK